MTLEYKSFALNDFKADDETRAIEGWASVFDNVDSQKDIVVRGAFARSLRNGKPAMLWQHRPDMIPGVWDVAEEADKGLLVRGRILDTTLGNDTYKLAKAGAVKGLSIGYTPKRQEFDRDKGTRKLLEVDLHEVSLVTFPANERAKITRVKAAMEDMRKAAMSLKDAIDLHQAHMDGTEPTSEESQMRMMKMMKKAYAFLTDGEEEGMEGMGKSAPGNEREFEELLREAGYSREAAKIITAKGFKALSGQREAEAGELSEQQAAELAARFRKLFNHQSA